MSLLFSIVSLALFAGQYIAVTPSDFVQGIAAGLGIAGFMVWLDRAVFQD